ncbi:hypothetical protein N2152v2_004732 [Parachlorella kessleri]
MEPEAMAVDGQVADGGASSQHTLYVNNLYEKIKPDDMKKCMRCIFGQFGNILDVINRRTYRLRGQAWVVFERPEDARNALHSMQGFPFFDKPIRITFAKTKSDAVAKLEGSYEERDVELRKQKNKEARDKLLERSKERQATGVPSVAQAAQQAATANMPNKILFVENLPEGTNEAMLTMLFQQFPGFVEVRMVPQKPGIAFCEYQSDVQSTVAMQGLQGFKLATDKAMKVTYARQ